VWRIKVPKGELTCLGCGTVFPPSQTCPLCTLDDEGNRLDVKPATVETVSYLKDGEWELLR
jgi:rRNA maturation endonuclease Nob1